MDAEEYADKVFGGIRVISWYLFLIGLICFIGSEYH